ncbi:pentatricopeptide repeat-containing protein At3g02330, mitochondrial [Cryptomeria japonica]|uniref:pentatricopeptide repeat-containing protein At3g02330, mitochondrial n=1 Tax=Cryptomeria japonica TaxID=3369 RepID=UPI0027DA2BF0|nr:pentatricopeptide repeat-containing protein At3g02330, mitochondrial [Cryptomeria japonica]
MPSTTLVNLRKLCKEGQLKQALQILLLKQNVDSSTYFHLVQTCIAKKALSEGKQIHSHMKQRVFAFASNTFLQNTLIKLYDKCGSLIDARRVFEQMSETDIFSWNSIFTAYKKHGFPQQALTLFRQMQRAAVQPDEFSFSIILSVCAKIASLKHGLQIQGKLIRCKFHFDVTSLNILIDMYAKCGRVQKARQLFDKMRSPGLVSFTVMVTGYAQNGFLAEALRLFKEMPQRNIVSWTAIIAGCVQNGLGLKAMEFFKQMQMAGVKPNNVTFVSILPLCAEMGALELGKEIHKNIVESSYLSDVVVATALIDVYAKCGSMQKARRLFDKMHRVNEVSWTVMITGYTQNDNLDEALRLFKIMPERNVVSWTPIVAEYAQRGLVMNALKLFKQMQCAGLKPDSQIFAAILPACAKMGTSEQGMEIHKNIIESGFSSDVIVATALIDMYAKCRNIQKAYKLFESMPQRDVALWTAIIAGCAQMGYVEKAVELFNQMQLAGIKPNSVTFTSILPLCIKKGSVENVLELHLKIIESGFMSAIVVVTALIDVYAKCGNMHKAYRLFDRMPQRDLASWTVIIAGYTQNEPFEKALTNFKQMQLAEVRPDSSTLASILPACAKLRGLKQGMEIHRKAIENNFLSDEVVTALIYMYARCGKLRRGCMLFNKMTRRNVISWNAMILGYLQNGFVDKALKIFKQMQLAGVNPNSLTFACILPACGKLGALKHGMEVHQKIIKSGFRSDAITSALIDIPAGLVNDVL